MTVERVEGGKLALFIEGENALRERQQEEWEVEHADEIAAERAVDAEIDAERRATHEFAEGLKGKKTDVPESLFTVADDEPARKPATVTTLRTRLTMPTRKRKTTKKTTPKKK